MLRGLVPVATRPVEPSAPTLRSRDGPVRRLPELPNRGPPDGGGCLRPATRFAPPPWFPRSRVRRSEDCLERERCAATRSSATSATTTWPSGPRCPVGSVDSARSGIPRTLPTAARRQHEQADRPDDLRSRSRCEVVLAWHGRYDTEVRRQMRTARKTGGPYAAQRGRLNSRIVDRTTGVHRRAYVVWRRAKRPAKPDSPRQKPIGFRATQTPGLRFHGESTGESRAGKSENPDTLNSADVASGPSGVPTDAGPGPPGIFRLQSSRTGGVGWGDRKAARRRAVTSRPVRPSPESAVADTRSTQGRLALMVPCARRELLGGERQAVFHGWTRWNKTNRFLPRCGATRVAGCRGPADGTAALERRVRLPQCVQANQPTFPALTPQSLLQSRHVPGARQAGDAASSPQSLRVHPCLPSRPVHRNHRSNGSSRSDPPLATRCHQPAKAWPKSECLLACAGVCFDTMAVSYALDRLQTPPQLENVGTGKSPRTLNN